MQPTTVLIVEDDPLTLKAFRQALEQGGIRVLEARDADTAVATARAARPDLLVLDHALPHASGFELLARLRDQLSAPALPALLVTRDASAPESSLASSDPRVRVLTRPLEPSRLVVAVREHLSGRALIPAVDRDLPPPQRPALALLDGLTTIAGQARGAEQAERAFDAVGRALLRTLEASGVAVGVLYLVLDDGRLQLEAHVGLDDAGAVAAGEALGAPAALRALVAAGVPRAFTAANPVLAPDLAAAWRRLGARWILAVPLPSDSSQGGLLVLGSDAHDFTQAIWPEFAREAAARFRRAVELGETLARVRELADNLDEVIWLRTPDPGRVLYVNQAYRRVYGRSVESLYERPDSWRDLVHPDDAAMLDAAWNAMPAHPLDLTYRVQHPELGLRWVRGRMFPTFAPDGELLHYTGVAEDITAAKLSERRLVAARNELEALTRRLVRAQEEERHALARELHDEMGQSLTSLKLTLETGIREGRAPDLAGLRDEVARLLERVRALSLDLRPLMLDEVGLVPALQWHIDRFQKQTGIRIEFAHAGMDERCAPGTEIAAFRIIQEALTNVARHAGVRSARVNLRADAVNVEVVIADNGRGFDASGPGAAGGTAAREPAIGLAGMRERALLAGGRFEIESHPAQGTRIRALLPRQVPAPSPRAGTEEDKS